MGTNFYLRKIPTRERKEKLYKILLSLTDVAPMIKMVDDGHYKSVSYEINELAESFEKEIENVEEKVHLGKRSYGWQFLWRYYDGKFYDDNFESIKKFINQPDTEIVDEYGEVFTVKQFLEDEIGNIIYKTDDLYDLPSYYKEMKKQNKNYHTFGESMEFTSEDGLRFSRSEFS